MPLKRIAIVTDWGPSLGSGHLQRSLAICWYCLQRGQTPFLQIISSAPENLPDELRRCLARYDQVDCIIRDMRDSSRQDILRLQAWAPVVVIDDRGGGRNAADRAVDMFPYPGMSEAACEEALRVFVYGYRFLASLRALTLQKALAEQTLDSLALPVQDRFMPNSLPRDIDIALYAGIHMHAAYTEYLVSLLPEGVSYALLCGEQSSVIVNGQRAVVGEGHEAEILCRSRLLVSHFGILCYEATLAGCAVLCVNPTPYHAALTDLAARFMDVENGGVYGSVEPSDLRMRIARRLAGYVDTRTSVQEMWNTAIARLERFSRLIDSLAG